MNVAVLQHHEVGLVDLGLGRGVNLQFAVRDARRRTTDGAWPRGLPGQVPLGHGRERIRQEGHTGPEVPTARPQGRGVGRREGDPEGWWEESFKSHRDSKPIWRT